MTAASWRERIAVHPACELFGPLGADDLDELAEDIRRNGRHMPIVVWRASENAPLQLLDGRNRLDAMSTLPDADAQIREALRLPVRKGPETDPWAYVVSANLRRRHLTPEKKRELIDDLLKADPSRSNRRIAALTGSNRTTVGQEREKLEQTGDVSIVDTRTDTKGRQQPATKPPMHRQTPAADVANAVPRPAPALSKEQQLRELREHPRTPPALVSNTAAPLLLARQIEDFCSGLKDRRTDVERIDRQLRLRLARSLVVALGIDLAELAASGGGGGAQ